LRSRAAGPPTRGPPRAASEAGRSPCNAGRFRRMPAWELPGDTVAGPGAPRRRSSRALPAVAPPLQPWSQAAADPLRPGMTRTRVADECRRDARSGLCLGGDPMEPPSGRGGSERRGNRPTVHPGPRRGPRGGAAWRRDGRAGDLLEAINDTRHFMHACSRGIHGNRRCVAASASPPRSLSSVWLLHPLARDLAEESAATALVARAVTRRPGDPDNAAGHTTSAALARRLSPLDLPLSSAALRGVPAQPWLMIRGARPQIAAGARSLLPSNGANDRASPPGAALGVAWLAEHCPSRGRRCRRVAFQRHVRCGPVRSPYSCGWRTRWRVRPRVMPARSPRARDELTRREALRGQTRAGRGRKVVRGTPPERFREPKRVPKNGAAFRPHFRAPARCSFASPAGAAPGAYPNLGPKKGPRSGARVRKKSAPAPLRACR